jgi:photosystem II stability/assembly factor-like uncharacterized protein
MASDIFFTDSQHGWILISGTFTTAENGGYTISFADKLMKSSNGGQSWVPVAVADTGMRLRNVYFRTTSRGWLSSENGLHSTTDGGTTWTKLGSISPPARLKFITDTVGWGTTTTNGIMKTTDGGITWSTVKIGGTYTHGSGSQEDTVDRIYAAHFLDAQHAWVAASAVSGAKVIYKTDDGGSTWQGIDAPAQLITGLFFETPQHGWVLDVFGTLYETADAGTTWTPVTQAGTNTQGMSQLTMSSNHTAWAHSYSPATPFSSKTSIRKATLP